MDEDKEKKDTVTEFSGCIVLSVPCGRPSSRDAGRQTGSLFREDYLGEPTGSMTPLSPQGERGRRTTKAGRCPAQGREGEQGTGPETQESPQGHSD